MEGLQKVRGLETQPPAFFWAICPDAMNQMTSKWSVLDGIAFIKAMLAAVAVAEDFKVPQDQYFYGHL